MGFRVLLPVQQGNCVWFSLMICAPPGSGAPLMQCKATVLAGSAKGLAASLIPILYYLHRQAIRNQGIDRCVSATFAGPLCLSVQDMCVAEAA